MTAPHVRLVLPPATLAGERFKVTHQPIMTAYLAAAARRAGARVSVTDALLEGMTPDGVAVRAAQDGADIVAIVPYEYRRELRLDTALAVAAAVRARQPEARIGFLNGVESAEITALRQAVSRGDVDFAVVGDSEEGFSELLRSGEASLPAGVIVRRNGVVVEGSFRDSTDLDTLPFPDWTLFRWREYAISSHRYRRLPLLPILGSRACPYACDFCPQALFNTRQRHRVRSAQSVYDEIQELTGRYAVREVEFYDATFGTRPRDAHELCALLAGAARATAWTCNSRCDLLDESLLKAMQRAGCYRILFGVESGDQQVLDATGKHQDLGIVRETFAACRRHGIETIGSFIIGLPGDTPRSVARTIEFALELNPTYVQFHLARAIVDKPRWRDAGSLVSSWTIGDEGFNGPAYLPAAFASYGELQALHRRAYLRFYGRPQYVAGHLRRLRSFSELWRLANGGVTLLKQLTGAVTSRPVAHH